MNTPSYEVGRLAALTVRLALSSGLSPADASAALGLARTMLEEDSRLGPDKDGPNQRPGYVAPPAMERGSGAVSARR